jgi:dihydrofolate reductase
MARQDASSRDGSGAQKPHRSSIAERSVRKTGRRLRTCPHVLPGMSEEGTCVPFAVVRNVQLYIAQSLDGYIADREGGIGWLEPFEAAGEDHGYGAFMAGVGAVVMGAATYEVELGWETWPYRDLPVFVFTHRRLPVPGGADVRFVSGPVPDVRPLLDSATDENVFLVGGADLVRQFLDANALDELFLFTVPLLLGDGIPLFADPPRLDARLLGCDLYASGIAGARYALGG